LLLNDMAFLMQNLRQDLRGQYCHFGNDIPYARPSAKKDFLHEA
jgi:hypothetical protein